MYSKELTERRNEALKHRKELLQTEPDLKIKLYYTAVWEVDQKVVEASGNLNRPFGIDSTLLLVRQFTVCIFFLLDITPQKKWFRRSSVK